MTAQHHIIKETSESLGQLLTGTFKEHGYKRVHLVVAAPKQEAIEGKLPAVSVYLYNLTLDEEGFEREMEAQRVRARSASAFGMDYNSLVKVDVATEFTGYKATSGAAKVVAI